MNEVVGKMNVQIYIIVSSLDGAEFLLFRVAPSIKFEKNEKQQLYMTPAKLLPPAKVF